MFLIILLGFLCCFFIVLIFSLLRAGNRADQEEERILAIISQDSQKEVLLNSRFRTMRSQNSVESYQEKSMVHN